MLSHRSASALLELKLKSISHCPPSVSLPLVCLLVVLGGVGTEMKGWGFFGWTKEDLGFDSNDGDWLVVGVGEWELQ